MRIVITVDCSGSDFADDAPVAGVSKYLTRINHDLLYNVTVGAQIRAGSQFNRTYRDDAGKPVATIEMVDVPDPDVQP